MQKTDPLLPLFSFSVNYGPQLALILAIVGTAVITRAYLSNPRQKSWLGIGLLGFGLAIQLGLLIWMEVVSSHVRP